MRPGEEDGRKYFFTDRGIMERDITADEYLESGELDSNMYGTKLDTIRQVIRSGKMCILDCNPQVKLASWFIIMNFPFTFCRCLVFQ